MRRPLFLCGGYKYHFRCRNRNFIIEDDAPSLKALAAEKGKNSSSLYPKPLRALRTKRRRKK